MPASPSIYGLRERLSRLGGGMGADADGLRLGLGIAPLDRRLNGGLKAHALHEVMAASGGQATAANGFALGLAARAGADLVWVHDRLGGQEAGLPYGPGLREWGLNPGRVLLVRVRDAASLLAAAEEALRSGAADAVVMSGWGEGRAHGLTASRRLALAAEQGRTLALLVRAGAAPAPSAADTRWSIRAVPSVALEAGAPGRPAFGATLLRSRGGAAPGEWIMEWDGERRSFVEPKASGGLVSLPARRPLGARAA